MQRASIVLASASTVTAGIIHFAVIGEHAAQAWWLGVGFALVGLVQVALAISMILKGSRKVALLMCSVHFLVILGWGLSRTVGLPLFAAAWTRELPGLADITATILESASICFALTVMSVEDRRFVRRSILAGALGLFLLSGSTVAARTISGQAAWKPAQAHPELHDEMHHQEPDAASSNLSATTSHDHR